MNNFLSNEEFKTVVNCTPLVSIDFIIKNQEGNILLGRRVNKPAKDFLFVPGGRILKNEKINDAIKRLSKKELNIKLEEKAFKFIGVFEHYYEDSYISCDISTHYIVLAYQISLDKEWSLPLEEHSDYKWLEVNKLMKSNRVHQYVKNYFN